MDLLLACTSFHPAPGVSSWGTPAGDAAHAALGLAKGLRVLGHRSTLVAPLDPDALAKEGLSVARRLTPLTFEVGGVVHERTLHDARLPSGVEIVLLGGEPPQAAHGEEAARRSALFAHAVAAVARARLGSVRPAAGGTAEPELEAVVAVGESSAFVPFAIREGAKALAKDGGPSPKLLAGLARVVIPLDLRADVRIKAAHIASIGVSPEMFSTEGVEFYGDVSFSKAGAIAADRIVALGESPRASFVAPGAAHRLDGVFRVRTGETVSIGSGVDQAQYNPATDPHLSTRFEAEDSSGKTRGKSLLLQELELEASADAPLLAVVGTVGTTPSAADLAHAIGRALRSDLRVVVAISARHPELEGALERFGRAHAGRLSVRVGAPEPLLHRVVAAADFLLPLDDAGATGVPVRAAMRYGTLPVAPRTPAFEEAIVDADPTLSTGTGFLFGLQEDPFGAIQRAVSAHASAAWRRAQRRVMRVEGGWERAARRLERLIQQIEA